MKWSEKIKGKSSMLQNQGRKLPKKLLREADASESWGKKMKK